MHTQWSLSPPSVWSPQQKREIIYFLCDFTCRERYDKCVLYGIIANKNICVEVGFLAV